MKIVISPAKSLDFESALPTTAYTQSSFLEASSELQGVLRKMAPQQLSALMKISAKLGELNWQRNQDWQLPFGPKNARPAVYAFNGDVYAGLDAYTIAQDKQALLQDRLRILSGLYGLLKPLDLIQPYRLEMGTKLAVLGSNNLYEFWKPKITEALNTELDQDELFVNLASLEYFKAVGVKELKATVISPIFKDWKGDKLKMISFFAKKARGMMARYLIDTNAQTLADLRGFDYGGYGYSEAHTQNEDAPVFVR